MLRPEDNILDIGSGNGLVSFLLREKGFNTTPIDIHYGNYDASVKPILYDGKKLPFADKTFDTGMILTVLHHVEDPDSMLKEAARVCKHLIIMEDIYKTTFRKYLTFTIDSLANLFYSPCPHTNKTDAEWKQTFSSMNMQLISTEYRRVILVIDQAIYFLKC